MSNSILSFLEVSRRLQTQSLDPNLMKAALNAEELPLDDLPELIQQLETKMKEFAKNLEFEEAAQYRDQIKQLRERLVGGKLS